MYIGEYKKDKCLIIPLKLLTSFNFIDFVVKLVQLYLSYKALSSFSTSSIQPLLDLQFFTLFDTIEKQEALRIIINDILPFVSENKGRQWVPLYIAYTFAIGKRVLLDDYHLFFSDIEALFPGQLKNIKPDTTSAYDRYETLSKSLARECKKWFIDDGFLPPVTEWTSSKFVYPVNDVWRRQVQRIANNLQAPLKSAMC